MKSFPCATVRYKTHSLDTPASGMHGVWSDDGTCITLSAQQHLTVSGKSPKVNQRHSHNQPPASIPKTRSNEGHSFLEFGYCGGRFRTCKVFPVPLLNLRPLVEANAPHIFDHIIVEPDL